MSEQAIQQLAKDYDTACSNYCKAMVAMWQVVVSDDYLKEDCYFYTLNGNRRALDIADVRYVVHNRISAEDVEEWHTCESIYKPHLSLRDYYMYYKNDL